MSHKNVIFSVNISRFVYPARHPGWGVAVASVRCVTMDTPQTPPGWYSDAHDPNQQRWWDGRAWTPHLRLAVGPGGPVVSEQARRQKLETRIAQAVSHGWALEYATGTTATLTKRLQMSVFWNILGVIFTGGLWLIYVIIRATSPKFLRVTLQVDEFGVVHDR